MWGGAQDSQGIAPILSYPALSSPQGEAGAVLCRLGRQEPRALDWQTMATGRPGLHRPIYRAVSGKLLTSHLGSFPKATDRKTTATAGPEEPPSPGQPHTTVVQSCAHQLPPPLGGRQKETSSAPDRKSQQAGQLSPPGEDKQDGKGTGQTSGADWRALRATGAAHGRERRAGAREIKHSQQDTGHQKRAGVGNRKKVSEIGNKGNNGRQTDRQTGGQKRSEC